MSACGGTLWLWVIAGGLVFCLALAYYLLAPCLRVRNGELEVPKVRSAR